MNELQLVLIVIAIVIALGIYFLQNNKPSTENPDEQKTPLPSTHTATKESEARKEASDALNDLATPHIPVSNQTQARVGIEEDEKVPESQMGFSFEPDSEQIKEFKEPSVASATKHIIITDDTMQSVAGFSETKPDIELPAFGVPNDYQETSTEKSNVETTEEQVFALIVMGTDEFPMIEVNKVLCGVGLVLSDKGIFVKKDSMGTDIIKLANILEPGTFSEQQLADENISTPGVVLILELPTTVKAPAVMHDMIMMARKISQRLNGRMYNIERHLIKESDLQQMRDAAVAYESEAI